ncbi:hypothetical protein KAR91_41540 [Candidatus Pacearchaeota archaeon]|nr:hypothetical protein [Candidatus Pacearchaeota archaeon]
MVKREHMHPHDETECHSCQYWGGAIGQDNCFGREGGVPCGYKAGEVNINLNDDSQFLDQWELITKSDKEGRE